MQISEHQLERAARAYRNSMFGTVIEDKSWDGCKENWIRDFKNFLAALDASGMALVEKS